jgi:hypothetical protein
MPEKTQDAPSAAEADVRSKLAHYWREAVHEKEKEMRILRAKSGFEYQRAQRPNSKPAPGQGREIAVNHGSGIHPRHWRKIEYKVLAYRFGSSTMGEESMPRGRRRRIAGWAAEMDARRRRMSSSADEILQDFRKD